MVKRKIIETVEEYDGSGKLVKKTTTETTEDDNTPYVPYFPSYPTHPTYPTTPVAPSPVWCGTTTTGDAPIGGISNG